MWFSEFLVLIHFYCYSIFLSVLVQIWWQINLRSTPTHLVVVNSGLSDHWPLPPSTPQHCTHTSHSTTSYHFIPVPTIWHSKPHTHTPHLNHRKKIAGMMMMIAFSTIQSSLVLLTEVRCAQIYYLRFEIISGLRSHLFLFFFERKNLLKKKTVSPRSHPAS